MPRININQMLEMFNEARGVLFVGLTTKTIKFPGEGGFLKFQRGSKTIMNPFVDGIHHLMHQTIILKANYENMVNKQRERELEQYKYNLPEPPRFLKNPPPEPEAEEFIANELWNGFGDRDPQYPTFVSIHVESGNRYLSYRPSSTAEDGVPTPVSSVYSDAKTGQVLDFETQLKPFYKAFRKPKNQMTKKMIPWQTVHLENIVSVKFQGELYTIIHPGD